MLGFVVQAIVFGAGHAPYPNQPAFARPVELIIPSIGFGLLYVYFGLLPGIILHFTFDVVWFALPIFMASAPGIWFEQLMIVALTLVPLWIVLYRRLREGGWTDLPDTERNAAWTPPPPREHVEPVPSARRADIGPGLRRAWLGLGAAGLVFCTFGVIRAWSPGPFGTLTLPRADASSLARRAVDQHVADLPPGDRHLSAQNWRVLPAPDAGDASGHEFVVETSGEGRWRSLLGTYLPKPRWRVRLASFEGDIADRAEEWLVMVTASGEARNVRHTLPEGRAGASLDEAAARRLAAAAIQRRFGLDTARGQVKEISATPARLPARTDWTFTFRDETIAPLASGEPRIEVTLAGDEITAVGRYVYIPEDWQRRQRAAATRNRMLSLMGTLTFAALLVGSAVVGIVAWSRGSYAPAMFVAGSLMMIVASVARAANAWPVALASFTTAAPLTLQATGAVALGLVGLALQGTMVGLALGAMPQRLARTSRIAERDALHLGVAAGLFAAAVVAGGVALGSPEWARVPDVDGAGAVFPMLQAAIGGVPGLLVATVVLLSALLLVDRVTLSWTRRTLAGSALLVVLGIVISGAPAGVQALGWIFGGVLTAAGLLFACITLFRHDYSMIPVAVATMSAVGAIARGAGRPYPGALPGSIVGAAILLLVGRWWFVALRRRQVTIPSPDSPIAG